VKALADRETSRRSILKNMDLLEVFDPRGFDAAQRLKKCEDRF